MFSGPLVDLKSEVNVAIGVHLHTPDSTEWWFYEKEKHKQEQKETIVFDNDRVITCLNDFADLWF